MGICVWSAVRSRDKEGEEEEKRAAVALEGVMMSRKKRGKEKEVD